MDINKAIIIGRLTRDAELKYTSGGMAVCKFSIAVNRREKNGEQWVDAASFLDITAFGKTGENLNQYLVKGKQVAIDGEIRQDRWEKDGQTHSRVGIIANNIQLLGGNGESRPDTPSGNQVSYQGKISPKDYFPDGVSF